MIEPLEDSCSKFGFFSVPAIYKENNSCIAVINENKRSIHIKPGQKLATFSKCVVCEEKDERVHSIKTSGKKDKENVSAEAEEDAGKNEAELEETEGDYDKDDEEFSKLLEALKIEDKTLLTENPTLKEELKRILFKYREVFSDPENVEKEVGQTDLIEFRLKLK